MTLDDLRKIAEQATKGPWGVLPGVGVCQNRQVVEPITEDDYTLVGIVAEERIRPEDAEFIATFNPQKVLELLARLAAVEKLHEREPYYDVPTKYYCKECGPNHSLYPCRTIKAARGE